MELNVGYHGDRTGHPRDLDVVLLLGQFETEEYKLLSVCVASFRDRGLHITKIL